MFCGDTARAGWFCAHLPAGAEWGVAFGAGGYGPRVAVGQVARGWQYSVPQILQAPRSPGAGGVRGWKRVRVAGPLPQARQVRGGPRGVVPGAQTQPALTDARRGLLFPPWRGGGYGHQEKLQCLKDFHKDILKPSPGKPGHPARRTRPRKPQRKAGPAGSTLCSPWRPPSAWATSGVSLPLLQNGGGEPGLGRGRAGGLRAQRLPPPSVSGLRAEPPQVSLRSTRSSGRR